MATFSFYVTEKLNQEIKQMMVMTGKSRSRVIREILKEGLKFRTSKFTREN